MNVEKDISMDKFIDEKKDTIARCILSSSKHAKKVFFNFVVSFESLNRVTGPGFGQK